MNISLTPKQLERFWSKVDKSGDCWLWTGKKSDHGAPIFTVSTQGFSAYRVSYELAYGAISGNYRVTRKCSCTGCIKPEHLGLEVDPKTKTLEERLWEKVDKSGDCWLWKGKLRGCEGAIYVNGKFESVHRIVYEMSFGEIPKGVFVHQVCDNGLCVNPEHLYVETDPRGRSPEERFWEKVDKSGKCWIWTGKTTQRESCRYGVFWYNSKSMPAHRFAYELATGSPIPKDKVVCHKCDNSLCVNAIHLFVGTQIDNIADMDAKGRRRVGIGERVCTAKLTADQVREIRRKYAQGQKMARLAREYKVSGANINDIVKRNTWKHVD